MGQDVGSGGSSGSASYSSGTYTLTGTGIWNAKPDRLYFVYQTYSGDFDISARLSTLTFDPSVDSPTAGLMVREDLDPNARYVNVHQYSKCDPGNGVFPGQVVQSYDRIWTGYMSKGVADYLVPGVDPNVPCDPNSYTPTYEYLRLTRYKDAIGTYASSDGSNWIAIGFGTLTNLASSVKVGMFVTAGIGDYTHLATATFDTVNLKSLTLPYATSWYGNTMPVGDTSIQDSVQAMYVEPDPIDGRIYLSTFWDESTKEASIYLPTGVLFDHLDATHQRSSGFAVTSNGEYVYMAQKEFNVDANGDAAYVIRRYDRDGRPSTELNLQGYDGSSVFVATVASNVDRHIRGLACDPNLNRVYASDTMANVVRIYNGDLDPNGTISDPNFVRPRGLAVDPNGTLWIIADDPNRPPPPDPNAITKVFHYSSAGAHLSGDLYSSGWDPRAVTADPNGRLWVADAGPDQRIKKFNADGSTAGTFGDQGGVLGGTTSGLVSALKLNNPVGVGVDSSGNVYVAGGGDNIVSLGGTELRKFSSAGTLLWEKLGLEFVDCANADPASDGQDIYSSDQHYTLDYTKPTGQEWSYKGYTLDRFAYPDDGRGHSNEGGVAGGVFVRRYNGKRFLFVIDQQSSLLGIYRFADPNTSQIAIPAGLFSKFHVLANTDPINGYPEDLIWPHNQPQDVNHNFTKWIWRDANGDARIDPNEYEYNGPDSSIWGYYPDPNMDIWAAAEDGDLPNGRPAIRRYKFQGVDSHGVPTWYGEDSCSGSTCPDDYAAPALFPSDLDPNHNPPLTGVERAIYIPATKTMFVSGYSADLPRDQPTGGEFGKIGRVIARYDDWPAPGSYNPNMTPTWVFGTPDLNNNFEDIPGATDPNGFKAGNSMSIAGNRLYVAMPDTRMVIVFDATNGHILKTMKPGPEVGGASGAFDLPVGINAFLRANGEYVAFAEEDFAAKGLIYREGAPLYFNPFSGATSPFSVSNGTGGSTSVVSINGDNAIQFQDTTGGNSNKGSLFTLTLTSGPLLTRLKQIYALSAGSPSVSFDFGFRLERRTASTGPVSSGITGGIQLNKSAGGSIQITGDRSLFGTHAYGHDETSGIEYLETVDRSDPNTTAFRFTIVPNGTSNYLSSLVFRFQAQVSPGSSAEAYAIDDVTIYELGP